jgi:hypothetical protein
LVPLIETVPIVRFPAPFTPVFLTVKVAVAFFPVFRVPKSLKVGVMARVAVARRQWNMRTGSAYLLATGLPLYENILRGELRMEPLPGVKTSLKNPC